ncbi:MAG: aminotransferase class III-fold pyridoxal phosphate-dependent enzyme [Anaerolineales bacterium]
MTDDRNPPQADSIITPHDFWTWTAQSSANPFPLDRAEGVFLWDTDGRRSLDFSSTVMCVNIGHGDQRVIRAIQDQAAALPYAGPRMATQVRANLGRRLAELAPGDLNRFLFTTGGADANENAVKMARAFTGRPKVLARYRSYHGATHGALALTGDSRRKPWEPFLMPGVVHFHGPDRGHAPFAPAGAPTNDDELCRLALAHLEQVVSEEGPETIAAIVLEPVSGANGVAIPPAGYLQGVQALCRRSGILLVLDEVLTGFGRTGRWFACEHWDVAPDLMTLAKGLTSGYAPLGAVAISERIARYFDDHPFVGGLTYSGHPLCLAAALANIDVLEGDGLVARADGLAPGFARRVAALKDGHRSVAAVRAIGLLAAVEMESGPGPTPLWRGLAGGLRQSGLWVHQHDEMLILAPPLIITEAQLDDGFKRLSTFLDGVDARLVDGRG